MKMEAIEIDTPTAILVDDQPKQIKPIVDSLTALNVKHQEFYPSIDLSPSSVESISTVSVIFLDLYYESIGQRSFDAYIPAEWVNKIVPSESHPYFLILWTKDTHEVINVLNVLHELGKPPIGHLAAQKDQYEIGVNQYDVRELFDNIPAGFLEVPKSIETIRGQIIEVQNDYVLVNCRVSEKKAIFQVRRFDKGPFEGVVQMEVNVFVKIDIGTENGKRSIEFSQIHDDISATFVKDEMFEEFRDSPFSSKSEK